MYGERSGGLVISLTLAVLIALARLISSSVGRSLPLRHHEPCPSFSDHSFVSALVYRAAATYAEPANVVANCKQED